MKPYVIIGNGVAAAGCIEGIRSVDRDGGIVVVSEERHPVYCRPLISYYLEGKTDLERMKYRDEGYYERMGCRVLYGERAVKLEADKGTVLLSGGTGLPYRSVCVATGSSPFVPRVPGLETVKNKFTFLTLDDALDLEKAVGPESRVLIVGAGLIGLKCAEGLWGRVKSLTICDLASRVLSSILDDSCAAVMQDCLEKRGIRFLLGDTAERFGENTAFMKSGERIPFDALVMAVGVRPNTALVQDLGGGVNRGILVDGRMQTSIPDVYAAGDCTEGDDISCGQKRVLAILPNAYMQGYCAGVNMAGGSRVFDNAIPMNSIGFFGLHAMTAGSYFGPEEGGRMEEIKEEGALRRFYVRDGRLTGFILIGRVDRAGIYTSLIREKTPLDTIDFDLLKKAAVFSAFPAENRRKRFGEVV